MEPQHKIKTVKIPADFDPRAALGITDPHVILDDRMTAMAVEAYANIKENEKRRRLEEQEEKRQKLLMEQREKMQREQTERRIQTAKNFPNAALERFASGRFSCHYCHSPMKNLACTMSYCQYESKYDVSDAMRSAARVLRENEALKKQIEELQLEVQRLQQ